MTVLRSLMFAIISGVSCLENSDHVLKGKPLSHRRPSAEPSMKSLSCWPNLLGLLGYSPAFDGRANQIATEVPLNAAFKGTRPRAHWRGWPTSVNRPARRTPYPTTQPFYV